MASASLKDLLKWLQNAYFLDCQENNQALAVYAAILLITTNNTGIASGNTGDSNQAMNNANFTDDDDNSHNHDNHDGNDEEEKRKKALVMEVLERVRRTVEMRMHYIKTRRLLNMNNIGNINNIINGNNNNNNNNNINDFYDHETLTTIQGESHDQHQQQYIQQEDRHLHQNNSKNSNFSNNNINSNSNNNNNNNNNKVVNPSSGSATKRLSTIELEVMMEEELGNIVGLDEIKCQLRDLLKTLKFFKRRNELGVKGKCQSESSLLHMCFLGNPGTGKTSIARMTAKMMFHLGICEKDVYVEVSRENLVAGFVGQTALRTMEKIEEARGGVLFVDEAYRLCDKDYGLEAIETLMTEMTKPATSENGRVVMLFAGYGDKMQSFFQSNQGMDRRIHYRFHFPDYEPIQLAQMILLRTKQLGYQTNVSLEELCKFIDDFTTVEQRSRLNGSIVEMMIQDAESHLVKRIDIDSATSEEMTSLFANDFLIAAKALQRIGQ